MEHHQKHPHEEDNEERVTSEKGKTEGQHHDSKRAKHEPKHEVKHEDVKHEPKHVQMYEKHTKHKIAEEHYEHIKGVLERGTLHFFYRPRVTIEKVQELGDVQRLYILMQPQDGPNRLLIVAKKKLPDISKRERLWSFVDLVSEKIGDIGKGLQGKDYTTKTRGDRHVEQARPVGRAVYALVQHADHNHIVYVLEEPEKLGDAQKEFGIVAEGSYIVTCKNPAAATGPGLGFGPSQRAEFPQEIQAKFRGRRFMPADKELLNYPHAEIVWIGASNRIVEELGEVASSLEQEVEDDAESLSQQGTDAAMIQEAKLFEALHLDLANMVWEALEFGELI
jgi:hypothetical protein